MVVMAQKGTYIMYCPNIDVCGLLRRANWRLVADAAGTENVCISALGLVGSLLSSVPLSLER